MKYDPFYVGDTLRVSISCFKTLPAARGSRGEVGALPAVMWAGSRWGPLGGHGGRTQVGAEWEVMWAGSRMEHSAGHMGRTQVGE